MAVSVKVTVKGEIDAVIAAVKAEAAKNGVKFTGDATKGNFSGKGVTGNYTVSGKTITINITEKPWYATDAAVKDAISAWFDGK